MVALFDSLIGDEADESISTSMTQTRTTTTVQPSTSAGAVATTSKRAMDYGQPSFSRHLMPSQLSYGVADPFAPFSKADLEEGITTDSESGESYGDEDTEPHGADEEKDVEYDRSMMQEESNQPLKRWTSYTKLISKKRLWYILPPLLLALTLLLTSLGSYASSGSGLHTFRSSLRKMTFEDLSSGKFAVRKTDITWLSPGAAGDGVYSVRAGDGAVVLVNVGTGKRSILSRADQHLDENGQQLSWNTYKISADLKYIIFGIDRQSQWRWSSYSKFYVHRLSDHTTRPLLLSDFSSTPHTSIAAFSPKNHHIAYVHANDLYIAEADDRSDSKLIRITVDGSPTTFNGVPDWVYEEEVFNGDVANWWSPDASKLAYLSFDEHDVPEYEFPIYNPSSSEPGAQPYPSANVMRYPKPGFSNPKVVLHVFDLARFNAKAAPRDTGSIKSKPPKVDPAVQAFTYQLELSQPFPVDDQIIMEVTWVGPDDLMVRATDRIARRQRIAHFNLGNAIKVESRNRVVGKVVRDDDFELIDGGWAEPGQTMMKLYLDESHGKTGLEIAPGYLDIVPNADGFNHIAYFSPPDSKKPIFLTSGMWEVDGGIKSVDLRRGLIYFIAANPSIERHLYSIDLPDVEALKGMQLGAAWLPPAILTNTTTRGHHAVGFSSLGGFYLLNYEGPGIPWQRMVKVDDPAYLDVLNDNADLAKKDAEILKPDISYHTVSSEGFDLNVAELRPPNMDTSGRIKYPVLFQVYGGPASQKVTTTYSRDWHHYLASTKNYIIVTVDPRGTGAKGRKFRMPIRNRLGTLEAMDTVNAAKHYASLPYIDEERIGIWGWSYGGYLTTKVVETNSSVFTTAMAVAPVTDWRYYDSIYTERYMSTPQLNGAGYDTSAIRNMEGYKHIDFALAHGSGDDNVHFLNSAALLDRLTSAGARGYRFRMFTDSDHSMSKRAAYWELMHWLTDFLVEKWGEVERTTALELE